MARIHSLNSYLRNRCTSNLCQMLHNVVCQTRRRYRISVTGTSDTSIKFTRVPITAISLSESITHHLKTDYMFTYQPQVPLSMINNSEYCKFHKSGEFQQSSPQPLRSCFTV